MHQNVDKGKYHLDDRELKQIDGYEKKLKSIGSRIVTLKTLRSNIKNKYMKNRGDDMGPPRSDTPRSDAFLQDARLIWENAKTYNGPTNEHTLYAESLYRIAESGIAQLGEDFPFLEMEIRCNFPPSLLLRFFSFIFLPAYIMIFCGGF